MWVLGCWYTVSMCLLRWENNMNLLMIMILFLLLMMMILLLMLLLFLLVLLLVVVLTWWHYGLVIKMMRYNWCSTCYCVPKYYSLMNADYYATHNDIFLCRILPALRRKVPRNLWSTGSLAHFNITYLVTTQNETSCHCNITVVYD